MLLDLDLPQYQADLRIKTEDGVRYIWDVIRAKWLILQPEEWVRQLLVLHLLAKADVNRNRIAIERGLQVNQLKKRTDILVFDRAMDPWLLVECKAPSVPLDERVFRQIATYNMPLQVPYLLVCNGPQAYCCHIDFEQQTFVFLPDLPTYAVEEK